MTATPLALKKVTAVRSTTIRFGSCRKTSVSRVASQGAVGEIHFTSDYDHRFLVTDTTGLS